MRKVSFSWKPTVSGREKWRWGLFMIVPSRSGRSDRLRILVRGLLLWLVGFTVAAYLALATAWFLMLERRPVNYVSWVDCVFAPLRWDEIRHLRGEAFIAEGMMALENRRWSEAVLKLHAGLARAPHHWRGRRNLGLFYMAAGQRQRGLNTLLDGLDHHYPGRDAVQLIMQLGVAGENFDVALVAVEKALALDSGAVSRDREWLIDQKCRILMVAERYEEALDWIAQQERITELRHESRTVALMELQRHDEARESLATWEQGSGILGGVRRLKVRLEREVGDVMAMRATLAEMRNRAATNPQPWVYSIVQEQLAGETEAAEAAMDQFLMRFGLRSQHVVLAAQPLKQIEAWVLFDRLLAFAADHQFDDARLMRLKIEAAMDREDYDTAAEQMQLYRQRQTSTPSSRELAWYQIMEVWIRHLDLGDDASGQLLISRFQEIPFELAFGSNVAARLEEAGRDEIALEIWRLVNRRYPASQHAQTRAEELREQLGQRAPVEIEVPLVQDGVELDLEAVLPPAEQLPSEIAAALRSLRLFESLAETLVEEKRWSELDQLLRELRRARPDWLVAAAETIYEAEIELNFGDENWSALITNVRMRVDGSLDRALEVMKLARRLDGLGERGLAEQVLREIERRRPDFPPARRLREDWAAEAEKAESAAPTTP